MLILGLAGARYFSRLITFPKKYLIPSVLVFCLIGSYAINNSLFDVGVLIVSGFIGFVLRKLSFSVAPIILGLILGPIFESNLRRALMLSEGDWSSFVTRPISLFFLIVVFLILLGPTLMTFMTFLRPKKQP
jgi:putative tricarboxylic transport membrane protein